MERIKFCKHDLDGMALNAHLYFPHQYFDAMLMDDRVTIFGYTDPCDTLFGSAKYAVPSYFIFYKHRDQSIGQCSRDIIRKL